MQAKRLTTKVAATQTKSACADFILACVGRLCFCSSRLPACGRIFSKTGCSLNRFAALIGLGASYWVVSSLISPVASSANAPHQIAQADTNRLNLYIERQLNETYEILLRRATDAAIASAQQSFESDRQVSKVVVMVSAENDGLVVPILTLEVSRNQWENRIQPQRWVTNLTASRILLGFERSIPVLENAPSSNSLPKNALPTEPPGSPL